MKISVVIKMLLIRRLPGIVYCHRYTVYSGAILLMTFTYLLFRWNLICSNIQAWHHVKKMCNLFNSDLAIGSLCAPLCISSDIKIHTCHSFQSTKEAVFSAEWHDTRLVFKSAFARVHSLHWYDNGNIKYPSDTDFLTTVKAIAKNKINITLSHDVALKLSRLKPTYEETDKKKRRCEMDNLWVLLQDNEYLLSALHTERDVFPQLLGTCGPYFAVEYLDPVETISSLLTISDDKEEWGRRLKISLLIIELIDELETAFREPYHLCDIKLNHFGLTKGGNKVKFLDLVGVYPKSAISSIIKENNFCLRDEDCEFFDCRGRCDTKRKTCTDSITNNNLQVICEKIFLGWRMSNTVLIPGLLMSQHTPSELASILRQCANPDSEMGKPRSAASEDIKKRLYNILIEIEQSVNGNFYLK